MSRAWLHALVFVVGGCSCGNSGSGCGTGLFEDECTSDAECLDHQTCSGLFGAECFGDSCEEDAHCDCDEECVAEECRPSGHPCPEEPLPECLLASAFCADDAACCNARCIGHVCTDKVECVAGSGSCAEDAECCSGVCEVGACLAPKCTPGMGPEVVVDADTLQLVQSAESLYWIEAGEVRSIAKRGGPVETLAVGAWAEAIARYDATLAWTSLTDELWTMQDGDAAPTIFSQGPSPVALLSINAQGVFWSAHETETQDAVYGAASASPNPPALIVSTMDAERVHAVATDDTHLYFSVGFELQRAPLVDGVAGPIEIVRAGQSEGAVGMDRIAMDAERVYFFEAESVRAVPKAGGEEVFVTHPAEGGSLAVDEANVYWTANDDITSSEVAYAILYRVPKSGGDAIAMVGTSGASTLGARNVLVDDTCVYWLDTHGGLIMRIAK